jgi:hypothetical protein
MAAGRPKPRPEGLRREARRCETRGEAVHVALRHWTAVLNAAANSAEEAISSIEGPPSRALRDLLITWNAKQPEAERFEIARALLELADAVNGVTSGPRHRDRKERVVEREAKEIVPNLVSKLSGRAPLTLRDAQHLVAATLYSWPIHDADFIDVKVRNLLSFANEFVHTLILMKERGLTKKARQNLRRIYMAADSTSPRFRLHELTISKNYESGHKDSIIINKPDDYNILQDAIKEDPLENEENQCRTHVLL